MAEEARHDALFPRAAAVVHQGGAGTLHQALRAGCPMLVVPHAHDQPDNAHRVVRLGIARTVSPARYQADHVRPLIASLIEEPGYRARAREVADVVKAESGADGAARAIEGLLA
ncbi:MAG: glycosyltransferase [Vicinamibacterales bacterium]